MDRDDSSREEALSRIRSQMPINDKVTYATSVIENSGSIRDLEMQVNEFVKKIDKAAGWSWRLSWLCPPFGILSALLTLVWNANSRAKQSAKRRKAGKQ